MMISWFCGENKMLSRDSPLLFSHGENKWNQIISTTFLTLCTTSFYTCHYIQFPSRGLMFFFICIVYLHLL